MSDDSASQNGPRIGSAAGGRFRRSYGTRISSALRARLAAHRLLEYRPARQVVHALGRDGTGRDLRQLLRRRAGAIRNSLRPARSSLGCLVRRRGGAYRSRCRRHQTLERQVARSERFDDEPTVAGTGARQPRTIRKVATRHRPDELGLGLSATAAPVRATISATTPQRRVA
jgi:hypothetical protein